MTSLTREELSTPFLSWRWILLTTGYKGSLPCTLCEGLFALTFLVSRILNVPLCLKYIWSAQELWQGVSAWHFW
jgi:hypothetical protein